MMKVGGEFMGKWVHSGDGQSQNGGLGARLGAWPMVRSIYGGSVVKAGGHRDINGGVRRGPEMPELS
jgi:hypothetical protein